MKIEGKKSGPSLTEVLVLRGSTVYIWCFLRPPIWLEFTLHLL